MKVLVVYDSVSPNRNTEQVAKTLSDVLRSKGFDVDCPSLNTVDPSSISSYDCVLAGSPTMSWNSTPAMRRFLESFKPHQFAGKRAVAFDTRVHSIMSGTATDGLQNRLQKIGFKIAMPPLATIVQGSTRKNDFQLKAGELDKTKKYAADLAAALRE